MNELINQIDAPHVILGAMVAWVIYDAIFSPTKGYLWSRREIMRNQRLANTRRGITMRPGWTYWMPPKDGESGHTAHMSKTGREEGCCCGGNPQYYPQIGSTELHPRDQHNFRRVNWAMVLVSVVIAAAIMAALNK